MSALISGLVCPSDHGTLGSAAPGHRHSRGTSPVWDLPAPVGAFAGGGGSTTRSHSGGRLSLEEGPRGTRTLRPSSSATFRPPHPRSSRSTGPAPRSSRQGGARLRILDRSLDDPSDHPSHAGGVGRSVHGHGDVAPASAPWALRAATPTRGTGEESHRGDKLAPALPASL